MTIIGSSRACAVVFATLIAPAVATGQPIFVPGDVRVEIESAIVGPGESSSAGSSFITETRVPFNEPGTSFERYDAISPPVSGFQWLPFPNPLPVEGEPWRDVFASTRVDAGGTGAVGVSGTLQTLRTGDRGSLRASVLYESTVYNIGTETAMLTATFEIPRIELVLSGLPSETDRALVRGQVHVTRFFTSGFEDFPFDLFTYQINYAEGAFSVSQGLLADAGDPLEYSPDDCLLDCIGLRYEPFTVTKDVVELAPGERLEFSYVMLAQVDGLGEPVPDSMAGGHAFYGDPLSVGGEASFFIHGLSVSPVPEPPVWAAMLIGLAGLALRRGRWNARPT